MKRMSKLINDLAYRHSVTQVFDDFMEMAICAFSFGKMENRYLELIKRYEPNEVEQFGHVLGAMVLDYEDCASAEGDWDDVLGNFFEQTSSGAQASRMGQFFTPKTVCDMMARMVHGDDEQKEITICDPACGSGRNLIAHSRLTPSNRLNGYYVGMDLDRRCVNMCVLNMFMYGLKGAVIHMDTLRLEVYGGYRIYLGETGLGIRPMEKNECMSYVTTYKNTVDEKPKEKEPLTFVSPVTIIPKNGEQFKLF